MSVVYSSKLELPGGFFKTGNAQDSAQLNFIISLDEESGPQ